MFGFADFTLSGYGFWLHEPPSRQAKGRPGAINFGIFANIAAYNMKQERNRHGV